MVSQHQDKPDRQNVNEAAFPEPPRYIEHDEITGRGSMQRLFNRNVDPPEDGRLSPADELILFKRMQYCGYRMSKMWDRLERLSDPEQRRYLQWYTQYTQIRDRLVNANMGLVYDMLSKNRFTNVEYEELRSEGLMALLRAVDTFNPWRGFRFSTYACNSILRAFARVAHLASKRQHLWSASYEPELEPSDWTTQKRDEDTALYTERINAILQDEESELNESERFVLSHRFPKGANRKKATLKSVGKMMNISKERVRQIQDAGLSKLRRALLSDSVLRVEE